jgi:hypothetical protein
MKNKLEVTRLASSANENLVIEHIREVFLEIANFKASEDSEYDRHLLFLLTAELAMWNRAGDLVDYCKDLLKEKAHE